MSLGKDLLGLDVFGTLPILYLGRMLRHLALFISMFIRTTERDAVQYDVEC